VLKNKSFLYRFLILFLIFALVGACVLGPLASSGTLKAPWIYLVLGLYSGSFVLLIVINEIVIHHQKK
jgi:hypothetical protein